MKKIRIFLILVFLVSGIAVEAQRHHGGGHNNGGGGCVATPLDGGLLTVLGAAGVGFYLFRKKNKNKEL
jgi:hypothetical protein